MTSGQLLAVFALAAAVGMAAPASAQPAGTAAIGGTLSSGLDATPLGGICVAAVGSGGEVVATVTSGPDGSYLIGGLAAGEYRVRFWDCVHSPAFYFESWYQSAIDFEDATVLTVADAETLLGIDGALVAGGVLAGTVTDEAGAALEGICVSAYDGPGPSGPIASTTTAANGAYAIGGLYSGDIRALAEDCLAAVPRYQAEWYADALDRAGSNGLLLLPAQVTGGIDFVLAQIAPVTTTSTATETTPTTAADPDGILPVTGVGAAGYVTAGALAVLLGAAAVASGRRRGGASL